jgi:hypothetical protein
VQNGLAELRSVDCEAVIVLGHRHIIRASASQPPLQKSSMLRLGARHSWCSHSHRGLSTGTQGQWPIRTRSGSCEIRARRRESDNRPFWKVGLICSGAADDLSARVSQKRGAIRVCEMRPRCERRPRA